MHINRLPGDVVPMQQERLGSGGAGGYVIARSPHITLLGEPDGVQPGIITPCLVRGVYLGPIGAIPELGKGIVSISVVIMVVANGPYMGGVISCYTLEGY